MTADSLGKTVSDEDMKKALSAIKTLKAYPDVEKGLTLLKTMVSDWPLLQIP
jgi:hypothetical protein